jgi:hypothetical protein
MLKPSRIALWAIGIAVAIIVALAIFLPQANAAANPQCVPFRVALDKAKEIYGQEPAFIATTAGGAVLTVTLNPATKSWTLWVQVGSEMMCVVSFGGGWETPPDSIVHPPEGPPKATPEALKRSI